MRSSQPWCAGGRPQRCCGGLICKSGNGKYDAESTSFADSLTLCDNLSAVQLDQMLHDCQTDTQTAMFPGACGIGLPETIEHERKKLRGNPIAGIGNLQERIALIAPERHVNMSFGWRELHGIRT